MAKFIKLHTSEKAGNDEYIAETYINADYIIRFFEANATSPRFENNKTLAYVKYGDIVEKHLFVEEPAEIIKLITDKIQYHGKIFKKA